jgi:hypothetical protein
MPFGSAAEMPSIFALVAGHDSMPLSVGTPPRLWFNGTSEAAIRFLSARLQCLRVVAGLRCTWHFSSSRQFIGKGWHVVQKMSYVLYASDHCAVSALR